MQNSWAKIRYFFLFLIILSVPFGIWHVVSSGAGLGAAIGTGPNIPQSFIDSKQQTAAIAQQIVLLSEDSAKRIEDIQELEQKGKYLEALGAIRTELATVSGIRVEAQRLLEKLGEMTRSLPGMRPESAREAALQAITYETQISDELISYSMSLDELLREISGRYISGIDNQERITTIVVSLRERAGTIQYLNNKYNEALRQVEEGGVE